MSFMSNIESRIVQSLVQDHHNDLEKEKIAFGVKLIMNDLWKVVIVYLLAFLLDCFFPTLYTHAVFFLLRHVSFGFHFQNSILCLFSSILSLPIGVFLINKATISPILTIILAFVSTILLILLAPIGTKKRPIFNTNHKKYLKRKMYIRLLLIWCVLFIPADNLQKFVAYGMMLQTLSVVTQKIVGGIENEKMVS